MVQTTNSSIRIGSLLANDSQIVPNFVRHNQCLCCLLLYILGYLSCYNYCFNWVRRLHYNRQRSEKLGKPHIEMHSWQELLLCMHTHFIDLSQVGNSEVPVWKLRSIGMQMWELSYVGSLFPASKWKVPYCKYGTLWCALSHFSTVHGLFHWMGMGMATGRYIYTERS